MAYQRNFLSLLTSQRIHEQHHSVLPLLHIDAFHGYHSVLLLLRIDSFYDYHSVLL